MTLVARGMTPDRIVFCMVFTIVLLREVTGAMRRFKPSRDRETPRPALLLFPLAPPLLFYQAVHVPLKLWGVVLGVLGLLASLALFEWSLRATGDTFFSWAGSEDTPQFLCENGPYAYIRNPFYASYLLSYVSTAMALQTVTSVLVLLAISLLFWSIARFEERKFANSPVAEQYAAYLKRTGRFFPRIWGA